MNLRHSGIGLGILCLGLSASTLLSSGQAEAKRKPERRVPYDEGAMPTELVAATRASKNLPLPQRMAAISETLLNLDYGLDKNGEGVAPDEDPPARYDIFDCVTFLEEIMALSMAPDPLSAPEFRNQIRYIDGEFDYARRNHIWLQQWIPNNIRAGFVDDITSQVGQTHLVSKKITAKTWERWRGTRNLKMPMEELPTGTFSLPVLSLDAAVANLHKIPAGAIIVVVRKPRSHRPIIVSHVGFVLPREGGPTMMRHATKLGGGRVRDHDLRWYLNHQRWFDKVPVEGISVLMPREQGPRRGAL
jgi:hypothetical protein